ncbi:hypothetical protein CHLNCDRAFT_141293 [Chlorella variabilis]|uniref:Zinc finger HIT domain-containing protein n=1 Tax=Chlorella variabilis TaxID=554065 RepID=E1ZSJ5_CHLVA|nr:hypothetical protein CHLNCDRAFT_141293 [Chlorella variabilis]EFN51165.1 hypothetical protein CHLNCDRAFT_141293 [Chlorella variabilis]|eukprot:XP_005843267.1 hypothetical protein CHLNCDRAFT_141293 [Chlorella variabilis]
MAAPQKLDLYLQGLGAFQEGAATLKSGDPLCLQQLEGGRLACVTQGGTPVGLVPADKRGMLMRGPWSGTVRSMRWQAVAPAAAAAGEAGGTAEGTPAAVAVPPQEAPQDGAAPPPSTQQQEQQQQEADQAGAQLAALVVQQVLVRFTPEEQRWQQRGAEPEPPAGDGATAHLSWEQFEQLAASEEVRWMLRDERLQKVVAEIDAAPNAERALVRALQAPNFNEFADKVLSVVAPEAPPT